MNGDRLARLRPGQSLRVEGVQVAIGEVIELSEKTWTWTEYRLDGHPGIEWLTVDFDDDEVEVSAWREHYTGPTEPDGRRMTVDGRKYKRTDKGVAAYSTPGGAETGRYAYVEYECDDDLLAFEKYDDEPWRSCTGRRLPLSAVEVVS